MTLSGAVRASAESAERARVRRRLRWARSPRVPRRSPWRRAATARSERSCMGVLRASGGRCPRSLTCDAAEPRSVAAGRLRFSWPISAMSSDVRAVARARARPPAAAWPLATRAQKDAALHAMADALAARRPERARGQRRGRRARRGGRDAGQHRRPAAAHARAGRRDGPGAARRGRAARPGRRGGARQHPGQRAGAAPGAGAVRRGRDDLRGPPQRHRRRGRDLPEVRQRGAAARLLERPLQQRRDRRRAARRGRAGPACRPTSSSWCPATATTASRS